MQAKYSKLTASLAVFVLSAALHEYLVSIPLHMYKIGVFLGMMVQVSQNGNAVSRCLSYIVVNRPVYVQYVCMHLLGLGSTVSLYVIFCQYL